MLNVINATIQRRYHDFAQAKPAKHNHRDHGSHDGRKDPHHSGIGTTVLSHAQRGQATLIGTPFAVKRQKRTLARCNGSFGGGNRIISFQGGLQLIKGPIIGAEALIKLIVQRRVLTRCVRDRLEFFIITICCLLKSFALSEQTGDIGRFTLQFTGGDT